MKDIKNNKNKSKNSNAKNTNKKEILKSAEEKQSEIKAVKSSSNNGSNMQNKLREKNSKRPIKTTAANNTSNNNKNNQLNETQLKSGKVVGRPPKSYAIAVFWLLISFVAMLVLATTVLLTAGGVFAKQSYLEPWSKTYYNNYSDKRLQLISHGLLAPSAYNLQPWRVSLTEDNQSEFYVYVDITRVAWASDPNAKEAVISLGSFLEYMNIASKRLGYNMQTEILPHGQIDSENLLSSFQNKALAKVVVTEGDRQMDDKYNYLFSGSINPKSYYTDLLTQEQKDDLVLSNKISNVLVAAIDQEEDVKHLKTNINVANSFVCNDREVIKMYKQGFRINEYEKNKMPYGFTFNANGDNKIVSLLKQGSVTLFPGLITEKSVQKDSVLHIKQQAENAETFFIISSVADSVIAQIEVGRAFANFSIEAKMLGLSILPMSVVVSDHVSVMDIKNQTHQRFAQSGSEVYMVIKVGKSFYTPPKTMRLSTPDVVVFEG